MRFDKLTTKFQQALAYAQSIAVGNDQQFIEPLHVLQADGGTRTASITCAYVALADAIEDGRRRGLLPAKANPLTGSVAAVSVGLVDGRPVLDLDYPEDSTAQTDMNVVMTGTGDFVEVQGTAEGDPFDRDLLNALLDLTTVGCADLARAQQAALAAPAREREGV